MSLLSVVKKDTATVFKKLYMKRRELTGEYEANWQLISNNYIKSLGNVMFSVDNVIPNFFKASSVNLNLINSEGYFSDAGDEDKSFFYGKWGIYRTLVKIEGGYLDGSTQYPTDATMFLGYVFEQVEYNEDGTAFFEVKPYVNIFEELSASKINNISGTLTAKQIIEKIRDHTDENAVAIFQKFITAGAWYITSNADYVYDISTATTLSNRTCWQLMKDLAAAENNVVYVDYSGNFNFVSRNRDTTTADWHFSGYGDYDKSYGHNILNSFKKKKSYDKIYNRIKIQYHPDNTDTSYHLLTESLNWGDSTSSFLYGTREYSYLNELLTPIISVDIANDIFTEFSYPKDEVDLKSKFLPQLMVNNQVTVSYQTNRKYLGDSIWGEFIYYIGDPEAAWGDRIGAGVVVDNKKFRIIEVSHDLNNFNSNFKLREIPE